MAAYFVFTKESVTDQGEMDLYQAGVGKTLAASSAKVLVAYGKQEVIEGEGPEGVVVIEFPNVAEAKAWYEGPAYQEVVQHRFRGAKYRATLVEGV